MTAWRVAWKCLVAWRPGELSQHPTWPHSWQSRRWTQRPPVARHSSQPSGVLGWTLRTSARWAQRGGMSLRSVLAGCAGAGRRVAADAVGALREHKRDYQRAAELLDDRWRAQ